MKYIIKILGITLVFVALVFTGCSQVETSAETTADQKTESTLRSVTDLSGQVVSIPNSQDINRIVITTPPLVAITNALIEAPDKIVGIHPFAIGNANKNLLVKALPNLEEIDTTYVKGFNIDAEKLLNLKPDIVFCYGAQQKKSLENLNVPVIDFYKDGEKNSASLVVEWEDLLRDIFQLPADSISAGELEKVEIFKANLSTGQSKSALFIFNNSSDKIVVAGRNTYSHSMMTYAGFENVAEEIEGEKMVSMEQLYEWQPDVIYLFMGPDRTAYLKGIDHQDWSRMKAVQNGEIYDIPTGLFHWASPCLETPLMMQWLLLEDKYDPAFIKRVQTFYEEVYKMTITDEMVFDILNPKGL